jgi:addiction module RelE/StbE family toxin
VTTIIWSPQSLRDLEGIRAYIAQDSPRYAELVVQRVVAGVERLEAFPESGRAVPELDRPETREVIVKPYRVVYRYRGGSVEIVTVFRSSRQIPEIA